METVHILSTSFYKFLTQNLGDIVHLERDQSDTWLAATTSLGLLGVIARVKLEILADFKVYANQQILDEDTVLSGDIYAAISPYVTANYWVSIYFIMANHTDP